MAYASVEMHYAYYHIPALLSSRFVIIDKLIHMCPKDFVSNRNINDIFEEAPPHLDRWEFVGLKARGILSPRRGRHNNSPRWSCVSSGTLGKTNNISEPRSVAEWVAEASA